MLHVSKVRQSWKQYFSHKGWIFDHMFVGECWEANMPDFLYFVLPSQVNRKMFQSDLPDR